MNFKLNAIVALSASALLCSTSAQAIASSTQTVLNQDLNRILVTAHLPANLIGFNIQAVAPKMTPSAKTAASTIAVTCTANHIELNVRGPAPESVSAFYFGLHKLGFLFPHPRMQISPVLGALRSHCGQTFSWIPALAHRGFDFQTEYPNEWVSGFFQGHTRIARDTVFWLARNFQNLMEVELLKGTLNEFARHNASVIQLAHSLQIQVGIGVSISMIDQRRYRLLPFWSAFTTIESDDILRRRVETLIDKIDFDFLSVDTGYTAFTPTWYGKTVHWLSLISSILQMRGRYLMVKVNDTTNEYDETYGNYNFLPARGPSDIGVLARTAMFYGLLDNNAPVYGRKNFMDIDRFMAKEIHQRRTWYSPETSFLIGMDLDVPLFLTDYLVARAQDYKHVVNLGVNGVLDSTSGQELGYWLFDWNLALQSDSEYTGNPMIGLQLLGENLNVWQKILNFETLYFKHKQLIQALSTSNFWDELPWNKPIHRRVLIRDLFHKESYLDWQIALLKKAIQAAPQIQGVKNIELREMLQVTFLRMHDALDIREAIEHWHNKILRNYWIERAYKVRQNAGTIMKYVMTNYDRYPTSDVFSESNNPTSYKYGYGWIATHLYYWHREELMAAHHIVDPFFMNLYDPFRLLF